MPSSPQPPTSRRSLGALLCLHPAAPPFEDVDQPSLPDIRQEAALRLVIAFRRLGKEIGPDPVAAFDAEPRLASLAYRWAYQDALRRHRGRGRSARPARLGWDDPALADFADLVQEDALDRAESDPAADLRRLWREGALGLPRAPLRRAILLLLLSQHLKDRSAGPVPGLLRESLRRLRRQTGLPLDTSLL